MKRENPDYLPPSPLEPLIRFLDIAGLLTIGAALFFGWQLGEWLGVGLMAALGAGDLIGAVRANVYRDELLELIGNLHAGRTQSLRV